MQLRQAGCGEGGDRVCEVRGRALPLQDPQEPHVRVHDQLHPQAETSAREVHDEQRSGELHHPPGDHQPRHPGDSPLHRLRVRGVHLRARRPASHLQTSKGLG